MRRCSSIVKERMESHTGLESGMDHRTGEIYDPNVYIPYDAMRAFWKEFARTELRPKIKIGDRDGSPRTSPEPLKLIGRSASGMLYMCDAAKDRDGLLYGLYRGPIAKY